MLLTCNGRLKRMLRLKIGGNVLDVKKGANVRALIHKIIKWWEGYVIPSNDPDLIIFPPYLHRPFLARCWEVISAFYLAHWMWLWTTAIGAATLFIALPRN